MVQPQSGAGLLVAETGLNKSGPEMLDEIVPSIAANNPANFGIIRGSIKLQRLANIDVNSGGVERYVAGRDAPHQLNIHASFAGDGLMTNLPSPDVDFATIHVLADLPSRLENTTGRAKLSNVARYAVALSLAAATRAQAPSTLSILSDYGLTKVFEGNGKEIIRGVNAVDKVLTGEAPQGLGPANPDATLGYALSTLTSSTGKTNPEDDVVLVVSDLLSGYDDEEGSFEWKPALQLANTQFKDRLIVAKLESPAQRLMPINTARGLDPFDVARARQKFTEIADRKEQAMTDSLNGVRVGNIRTDGKKSIKYQLKNLLTEVPKRK